jgi:uncharacterized protein involved in exopolysaccharide biosynthesis
MIPDSPVLDRRDDVSIADYLRVVRRHPWLIAIVILLFLSAAAAWSTLTSPVYDATATLLASQTGTAGPRVPTMPAAFFQNRQIAEAVLATADGEEAKRIAPDDLVRATMVEEGLDGVIRVTVRLPNPELAAMFANGIARQAMTLNESIGAAPQEASERSGNDLERMDAALKEANDAIFKYMSENADHLSTGSMYEALTRRPLVSETNGSRADRGVSSPDNRFNDLQSGKQDVDRILRFDREAGLRRLVLIRNALEQAYQELAVDSAVRIAERGAVRTVLQLIDQATPPQRPSSPRLAWNLMVAALAGAFASLLAAFAAETVMKHRE